MDQETLERLEHEPVRVRAMKKLFWDKEKKAKVLVRLGELLKTTSHGNNKIADILNDEGFEKPDGTPLDNKMIAQLISNMGGRESGRWGKLEQQPKDGLLDEMSSMANGGECPPIPRAIIEDAHLDDTRKVAMLRVYWEL